MPVGPNESLLEHSQVVVGFAPIVLTSARAGDVVSMKKYRRCIVRFVKGIGGAGEDPTLTLEQGTTIAFGTNKALDFGTIYTKQDPTAISQVGQRTKVTRTITPGSTNTYTDATAGEQEAMWEIDIKAEDLDIANDYTCIRASIGDVGSVSQVGYLEYELYDPIYSGAPEDMADATID